MGVQGVGEEGSQRYTGQPRTCPWCALKRPGFLEDSVGTIALLNNVLFPPCIREPHPRNSQCVNCRVRPGSRVASGMWSMRTDSHMCSLPAVPGPEHPHHVRTRLPGRR